MKRPTLTSAITSLVVAAQLFSAGTALGSEAIGTLGSIIGKANVVRNGKSMPVTKGMEVFATDELQTGPKTAVKILFKDGGNFMAFEDSKVKIAEYKFKTNGKDSSLTSAFDVAKGKVRFFVKPEPGRKNDTKFKTSNAVMGIRGTSGFIDATKPGQTQLVVLTGKVEVSNPQVPGQSVMVPPNQMTSVVGTRAPSAPRVAPPALMGSLNAQANRVDPRPDAAPASEGSRSAPSEKKGDGEARDSKSNGNGNGNGSAPAGESPGQEAPTGTPSGEAPSGAPVDGGQGSPGGQGGPSAPSQPESGAAPSTGTEGTATAPLSETPSTAEAPAAAAAPAGSASTDVQPSNVTVEKKNVFGPDGQASIVVNDPKLSAITAPTSVSASVATQASAAVRDAQTSSQVVKAVNEVVKTNTDKAIGVSTQALVPKPVAAEAPKSKNVKVKVVLPPAP
ncbi:MAG: FecR domain-containing protein [Silvanigrellales bacterium]|nr:FecR domain-containing protein [Silvanigrellales bacterium]